ncbi:MAG: bifunctional folylpolyglutamate synthase/dihydrofolate synthase [Erysipelotrichaceae bacterium]|nr:bifunctional folylpolyglutamate synthase/dihydrofolate synthase [Erysipelotrichaceae bacterium]
MMNHDQAIEWMIKQRNKEIGFSSFQKYLNEHENHLDQLNIVHIAGTNGKGSTVSMMMHCLKEAGYKVGTFTSPHLFVHEDRIRINGQILPEDDFLRIFNSRKEGWENYQLSMFEMDLDIASIWFCEQNVDIVLLEAGLGGKDDSTNVIASSLASVIVSVGLDHMDRLGDTVEKIAEQKAGIIKKNGLVICGERKTGCYEVIQKIAENKHAELIQMQSAEVYSENPIIFDYQGLQFELSERALYQVHNACCAIETILQLRKRKMISISNENLINGIKKAHWAGRFDVVDEAPLTIVDGAHNSHGIQALKESAKNLKRPLIGVFACLKDKDKDEMIASLSQIVDELILTEFDFYRAMPVEQLKASKNCLKYSDWKEAVKIAQGKAKEGTVLITGSLYFISEVMTYFKEKNSYPNCSFDSNASASTEEDNSTRTCA